MQRLSRVGIETGQLTDEEIRFIDERIIAAVRPKLIGRQLFTRVALPHVGIKNWRKYTQTDMSEATIDMEGIVNLFDHTQLAEADVKVPVLSKGFMMFWRDIIAARRGGIPIDTLNVENAARQIAEEEDKLLLTGEYTGWKALGIQGLATATGRNTQATAGVWSTIANIYTDISAAITKLEEDGWYENYVLILRAALNARLRQVNTNTSDIVKAVLLQMIDKIFVSDSIFSSAGATTSALVVSAEPSNFELGIAQDITQYSWQDKDQNTIGKVYEVLVPRVNQPTAICELTGLS
jgi:uncharacterized linocin/CFP29 family protein